MIYLAASPEGDIEQLTLAPGEEFYLQSGAYLASESTVTLDTKFGGFKGFFGAGMFLVKMVGPGTFWFNSYGALHAVDVNGRFTCDNDHGRLWALAWTITCGLQWAEGALLLRRGACL